MTVPPRFQRSPRLVPALPAGEVEIPAPPAPPSAPAVSLVTVLLPASASVLSLCLMLFLAPQGGNTWMYVAYAVPAVATLLITVYGFVAQKNGYERAMRARDDQYRTLLAAVRHDLEHKRLVQQTALRQVDPDPADCLARAEQRDARLWERAPCDPDFLVLRLGMGLGPFAVQVKAPRQELTLNPDPLYGAAQQLAADFALAQNLPVRLPLREAGAVGVVGLRPAALETARTLALQIATHHSPDEVKIAALFPASEAADWAWMRWLPHTWSDDGASRYLAMDLGTAQSLTSSIHDLLSRRRLQAESADRKALPAIVCFLADPHLTERAALVPLLLREGTSLGACCLIVADRREALPKECQAIVTREGGLGQIRLTAPVQGLETFTADHLPLELAERQARSLAPLRLQRLAETSEIPARLSLLDLLGVREVEDLAVLARWQTSEPERTLAAPIGVGAGGERLLLDLHERGHGPHGLAAGATGSGKSELLQSVVASLAVSYHPHDLVFVLVDYKGGGMANAFADLPHRVGTITNLQGNLAVRALAALKGELKRRQMVLGTAGLNHIDDYQRQRRRGKVREPLPHLVIVVDEFAELKMEQPDFMRELVSAVRVGRSLGVHLILATQKPAGIVDEQIWGNARFRLCLRVERPEDSQEVIKRPDAAGITRPGRAYLQVGNNELFQLFQAGWGGAPYRKEAPVDGMSCTVARVTLDGRRHILGAPGEPAGAADGPTQLQAMVAHLAAVAGRAGIAPLPGPWLPPLPDRVFLPQILPPGGWTGQTWAPSGPWLEPVIGLADDPAAQHQGPLRLNLGKEGHLAIFGAPGTGKTTAIQTLAISLALAHAPDDLHLYLLDFGGRLLTQLADLPHVGGVLLADEAERVMRLMRFLLAEADRRKSKLAEAGAATLAAYRQTSADPIPAVVVMLDNYAAFSGLYPEAEEALVQLAREGGSLGIHLVLTANSPSGVKPRLAGNVTLAVALTLADRGEYSTAVGRTNGLEPEPVAGRALVRESPPLEFQIALPTRGESEVERAAALRRLAAELSQAWTGMRPREIGTLPDLIPLSDLPPHPDGKGVAVALGREVETLDPFYADLQEGPHFLISGPAQSGKSTLLQTWILSLAQRFSAQELHLYLFDALGDGLATLRHLPHVRAFAADDAGMNEALSAVANALQKRRQAPTEPSPLQVLALDGPDALRESLEAPTKERLEQLVRRERARGFHLLLAGSTHEVSGSWDGYVKALRELQTGFLVGSSDHADLQLFNLRLPMGEAGGMLPPGQGFYARRGRYRRIKAAIADAADCVVAGQSEGARVEGGGVR